MIPSLREAALEQVVAGTSVGQPREIPISAGALAGRGPIQWGAGIAIVLSSQRAGRFPSHH